MRRTRNLAATTCTHSCTMRDRRGLVLVVVFLVELASRYGASQAVYVWPVPQREQMSGPPLPLAPLFAVTYVGESEIATEAAKRYTNEFRDLLRWSSEVAPAQDIKSCFNDTLQAIEGHHLQMLRNLSLVIVSHSDKLESYEVNESYIIRVTPEITTGVIEAHSPFGALHGLQTFMLLVDMQNRQLPHDNITIVDTPDFPHRSLMVDTARRFYPIPFLERILDSMAMAKLNVLHLHLSDYARLSVESKLFPELNIGYMAGEPYGDPRYWKQSEVRELVTYARNRGIRVVAELELPQHARYLWPLVATHGLAFCNHSFPTMLYDDPDGNTVRVLHRLLDELASLFPDEVLHLGMDEAQCYYSSASAADPLNIGMCGRDERPRCDATTILSLERKVLHHVHTAGKTPMVWQNGLFDCGDLHGCSRLGATPAVADSPNAIIGVYSGNISEMMADATSRGYRVANFNADKYYLDAPKMPKQYQNESWCDPAEGLSGKQRRLVLGGGLSLWSDNYCAGVAECGGWRFCPGFASASSCVYPADAGGLGWMQSADEDEAFMKSAGALLFPRANIAAGSMWNYKSSLPFTSSEFRLRTASLAASQSHRKAGVDACPSICYCDFVQRCAIPYQPKSSSSVASPTETLPYAAS